MGWSFPTSPTRRSTAIADLVKPWSGGRDEKTGITSHTACLAHCYRGGAYRGILWAVFEVARKNDELVVVETMRFIACFILQYAKEYDSWGYKDMEESMGPYYYSCPLKYFDMVPETNEGVQPKWREAVRQHHQLSVAWRRVRKTCKELRSLPYGASDWISYFREHCRKFYDAIQDWTRIKLACGQEKAILVLGGKNIGCAVDAAGQLVEVAV
jgi:hypothetical protein